jgi:hypothetical protein
VCPVNRDNEEKKNEKDKEKPFGKKEINFKKLLIK